MLSYFQSCFLSVYRYWSRVYNWLINTIFYGNLVNFARFQTGHDIRRTLIVCTKVKNSKISFHLAPHTLFSLSLFFFFCKIQHNFRYVCFKIPKYIEKCRIRACFLLLFTCFLSQKVIAMRTSTLGTDIPVRKINKNYGG